MGTTPKYTIPYIEPTDLLASYPTQDKAQADRLEAIFARTAWVSIPAKGPGTLQYSVLASLVFWRVALTIDTPNNSQVQLTTSAIPPEIKPSMDIRGPCDMNGIAGSIWVESASGLIKCRQTSGATKQNVNAFLCVPLG